MELKGTKTQHSGHMGQTELMVEIYFKNFVCTYVRQGGYALGVNETEFLLHIDHEKIKTDSQAYLSFKEPKVADPLPTDITHDLIAQLVKESAAGSQALAHQETQMSALLPVFEKLLTRKGRHQN